MGIRKIARLTGIHSDTYPHRSREASEAKHTRKGHWISQLQSDNRVLSTDSSVEKSLTLLENSLSLAICVCCTAR
jgi:hypothetical protein